MNSKSTGTFRLKSLVSGLASISCPFWRPDYGSLLLIGSKINALDSFQYYLFAYLRYSYTAGINPEYSI